MNFRVSSLKKLLLLTLIFTLAEVSPSTALLESIPSKTQSLKDLSSLKVKAKSYSVSYKRSAFGEAWLDVDKNDCDTRNDILHRDLFQQVTSFSKGPCVIESGKLLDPYTNKTISFTRGLTSSQAVQIDHIVSLANAWHTGAYLLSESKRVELANDPIELLATSAKANSSKSDLDASQWLPENKSFYCSYASLTIAVKKKYQLWVTKSEKSSLQNLLKYCKE